MKTCNFHTIHLEMWEGEMGRSGAVKTTKERKKKPKSQLNNLEKLNALYITTHYLESIFWLEKNYFI